MKPLLILLITMAACQAQGPLAPSASVNPATGPIPTLNGAGAPQASMKTLHQVEPRIPLVAGFPGVSVSGGENITISQAGSYYLTRNLTVASGNGITITAPSGGVSIDLEGFTITSTSNPASGYGIYTSTTATISIRNGHVHGNGSVDFNTGTFTGSGFGTGVDLYAANQVSVSDLHVFCVNGNAIRTDKNANTMVDNCTARSCGGGILGKIISRCQTAMIGASALDGNIVSDSIGYSYVGTGIGADGGRVTNSTGSTLSLYANASGIYVGSGTVVNSTGITFNPAVNYAIVAKIAIGCNPTGPTSITNKYNMP